MFDPVLALSTHECLSAERLHINVDTQPRTLLWGREAGEGGNFFGR